MNLSALKSEVQSVIGNTDSTVATQITNWLNWAVLQMSRRHDWTDLISLNTSSYDTVAGTATVSLATTVKKIYDIRYVDTADDSRSRQLIYRPAWVANRLTPYPPGDAQNTPLYYWRIGRTLYLYPIPDEAKDLYMTIHSWPTAMSAGTDEPSITNVDDAIVAGAVQRAYMSLPQLDGADLMQVWGAEFVRLTTEASMIDKKLGGWRPLMRLHNAAGPRQSYDPTADPYNQRGNYLA